MKSMKMIKKIATTIAFFMVMSITAQKSVVLKYNYKKGEKYLLEMSLKQNMGIMGGMNMTMKANMGVVDVTKETFQMSTKLKKMTMNSMQGGQEMKFDSDMKAEELDEQGKQLKAQIAPLMKAITYSTFNHKGEMLSSKSDPPGLVPASNQNYVNFSVFPTEAVSVGSTWTNEQDIQGVKLKILYTVKEITSSSVIADISGTAGLMGIEGKITGASTFNRVSGNTDATKINLSMNMQGVTITMVTEATIKKLN